MVLSLIKESEDPLFIAIYSLLLLLVTLTASVIISNPEIKLLPGSFYEYICYCKLVVDYKQLWPYTKTLKVEDLY